MRPFSITPIQTPVKEVQRNNNFIEKYESYKSLANGMVKEKAEGFE